MEDDSPAARRPGRTDSDLPAEGSRYSGRVLRVAEDLCDRYALSVLRAAADLNSRAFQTRYDEEPERVCSPIPAPYDPQIDVALLQTRLSEEQDRARSYVAERDELAQLVQDHSVAQLQLVRDHAAAVSDLEHELGVQRQIVQDLLVQQLSLLQQLRDRGGDPNELQAYLDKLSGYDDEADGQDQLGWGFAIG